MEKNEYTRREFVRGTLGVVAGAAVPQVLSGRARLPPARPRDEQPNVVYIMADQLRACSVGVYGNPEVSTPEIDQCATEAARFDKAVSSVPVCSPHRACLMTGRYPTQTGVFRNGMKLPADETGIAEVFRQNGYYTGYIGKWHLNGPTPRPTFDPGWVPPWARQGFRMWTGYNNAHVYYDSQYYLNNDRTRHRIPSDQYEPDWQTGKAMQFISQHADEPFFLLLSIGTPHPGSAGGDHPPGGDYVYPFDPSSLTLRPNVDHEDEAYARQEYADYYGITSNFDWNVGRILARLDRLGLAENTIVVISSDHGDYLGSHFGEIGTFRGKSVIYAESIDVPFVLRWPGQVAPMVLPDLFCSVDIMPTLLGLCGLPVPDEVMGRDFSPVLTGTGAPVEPPWGPVPSNTSALVGMYYGRWIGIRNAEYTLLCEGLRYEPAGLYHNVNDPYQQTNLVDDPDYDEVVIAMHDETMAWFDYVRYQDHGGSTSNL